MNNKPTYEELEQRIRELEQVESDRKQEEHIFIKERDFISNVLYWIDSLVVVIDIKGHIISFNRASEQLSGYCFEELQGRPFWEILLISDEREGVKTTITDVHNKELPKDFRNHWVTKTGEKRLIHWNNSILKKEDGSIEYILCTGLDITERQKTETDLIENEEKYRELVQNANSIIIRIDTNGKFTFFNEFAQKFFGYTEEEIIGESAAGTILPDTDTFGLNLTPLISDIIKNPDQYVTYENENMLRNGQRVWVAWTNKIIFDKKGDINGILCIGNDITDRKQAEEELRESEEKLVRSKKMESLGLLAGGVAHDLNNILSGIVNYPELILMELPEDSKFRKSIEAIQESGYRAAAIVQDLITIARGVAITRKPLNLNDLVNDYLHSPEFNKLKQFQHTVTVKPDLDKELFNINGSHVHIRKVVMNLVSNAAEAIEGSGRVTISTMNCYMDKPLRGYDDVSRGEYVVLSVSDDGPGILSDDLERIFEPFYTKKMMGRSGTGLGLAVVWNIMQDHKGYIDVLTDENGTTFELYFPMTREEVLDTNLSIQIKDYEGNGETILVVDDVESQRDISCKMLSKLGYHTKSVPSGEEAVEYLKQNSVDLILLDMIMDPGINGREAYERIIEIHPKQKALIVSGFAVTGDVKAAQKLGAGKYIKKPYTIEKIGFAVKEELEK